MSRRRGQTPRPGRGGGQNGAGRGADANQPSNRQERRSFLERIRVPSNTAADAPAGMRANQQRNRSRGRKRQRWSVGQILVFAVMVFLAVALALSGLIAFLPPPGSV